MKTKYQNQLLSQAGKPLRALLAREASRLLAREIKWYDWLL